MKFIYTLKTSVLALVLFLFPLFFLPTTQEFFTTNKLYLVSFGALLLLTLSLAEFTATKKLSWKRVSFDSLVAFFLISLAISIVVSSTNKIQAVLNPNLGIVAMVSLSVLYFYLSRHKLPHRLSSLIFHLSSLILSLTTIIFFFQPLKNAKLPQMLEFLKNPVFTSMGNQIDLAVILGLFTLLGVVKLLRIRGEGKMANKELFLHMVILFLNSAALFLSLYILLKPSSSVVLPPFRLSWYAAVEVLKSPLSALFGVGVDNYSIMFARVKDIFYNQSSSWQIGTFASSRSTFLHIMTEAGLVGLAAFLLLLVSGLRHLANESGNMLKLSLFYLIIVMFFLPPSLTVFFLLFVVLGLAPHDSESSHLSLGHILPLYFGMLVVAVVLLGSAGYFVGRSYAAEYYFKKSLDGFVANNAKEVYDNQRQAVLMNPYIERFRTNFSQVNLLIANNLAAKKPEELTNQDRQNIAQAIQAAISEAKAAATLNSQKAANWENLAAIYRNVLSVAQGADTWTISSYQRAMIQDPSNPSTRLNLGGIYYTLANYEEAAKFFEQAISLKPDWANAYYNLAWASYQKGDYQKAVNSMQNVLTLVDPKTAKSDYDKAAKDLEEFKKKLPSTEQEATKAGEKQQSQLNLPTVAPTLAPKIQLPNSASPEAK